ncbi:MAG: LuxR C-terminal-related transcriptional regulator [Cytophagales bacterium]
MIKISLKFKSALLKEGVRNLLVKQMALVSILENENKSMSKVDLLLTDHEVENNSLYCYGIVKFQQNGTIQLEWHNSHFMTETKKQVLEEIYTLLCENDNYERQTEYNYQLSDRELEVLGYICKGKKNSEIAEILFISENTVATHRRNLMKKIGVNKTSELIIWGFKNNILF